MPRREYIAEGGMRLHLDEPITDPLMAAQVKAGRLRPVRGAAPEVTNLEKSQVVAHGSEATTVDRVGVRMPGPEEKPGDDDHVSRWATYATRLGLLATQAATMSLRQLQEWVEAWEQAQAGQVAEADPSVASSAQPEPDEPQRPTVNDKVADWRTYAVRLGMSGQDAETTTKADLITWAASREQAASEPRSGQTQGQE